MVTTLTGCITQKMKMALAVEQNNVEEARKLIAQGCDINFETETSPLLQATYDQHAEMVRLLLDNGARVDGGKKVVSRSDQNIIDCRGATPLSCAAERGNAEIAGLLVAHGADVNHPSKDGITPLMAAAKGGNLEIIDELLNHGADVHHVSKIGEPPLMFAAAAQGDKLDNILRLVHAGADINSKTPKGVTAFGLAALKDNPTIALWLFENGADPSIPEKQCEIYGKASHFMGDYYLSLDDVDKAHASFQQARRSYLATVTSVKVQLSNVQLVEGLVFLAGVALDVAGSYQAGYQSHQLAQIAALRNAQKSGGIRAYSLYVEKYQKDYVPTYFRSGLFLPEPPPGASVQQTEAYLNAKIKYYKNLASYMDKILGCFTNNPSAVELHARIEQVSGESSRPAGAAK